MRIFNKIVFNPVLGAENVRLESFDESENNSDIGKFVKCSSFRENIKR